MSGPDVVVTLPTPLRGELKDPLGPVYTDAGRLLADARSPVVAVGDIVTYHLLSAGATPDVALVDERTKREAVDDSVREAVVGDGESDFDVERAVENPAGTLTAGLLDALADALEGSLDSGETTLLIVDGEEDLAALPAVLAVPEGASVVYGQPGEGMVLVAADDRVRARVRSLIERMDGAPGRLFETVDRSS